MYQSIFRTKRIQRRDVDVEFLEASSKRNDPRCGGESDD